MPKMFFSTAGLKDLECEIKYTEGQELVLTAGEAEQFSQTYCENMRNSLAPKVKAALEAGGNQADVQALYDDRAKTYVLVAKGHKTGEIEKVMAEISRQWAKDELRTEGLPQSKDAIAAKSEAIFDDDETALRECAVASIAAALAARSRPIKGESDLSVGPED